MLYCTVKRYIAWSNVILHGLELCCMAILLWLNNSLGRSYGALFSHLRLQQLKSFVFFSIFFKNSHLGSWLMVSKNA